MPSHGRNTKPWWTRSPAPRCSGKINVLNFCVWRPGLWWLSLVEFLPFRCGCLSVVWWNVAEYLGCQNINRWGEHAKRANVNTAHVINPSNPPPAHTCHGRCSPCSRARHWAHCFPRGPAGHPAVSAAWEENSKERAQSLHLLRHLWPGPFSSAQRRFLLSFVRLKRGDGG